ncbi:MAG: diguanylate cyclase [Moritella sp.]|uniref:GGDEF domain-containing protein n=1 Tax=Moritella sp. TaxID=78556 RepID=UPI0029B61C86|nr:diguanylate cyclase [Moritella sp.]MDX2321485.1 diguanylate cyclase [Moritella sp.]
MSKKLFALSAQYFKKAMPLMIQYQIPTTPTNYALWYHYVSDKNSALKKHLDDKIAMHGTCTPAASEELYQRFIVDKREQEITQLRCELDSMTNELSSSLHDTLNDTNEFDRMLNKCLNELSGVEEDGFSIEKTLAAVRELVKESHDVRSSTRHFKSQLHDAQAEISQLRETLLETQHDAMHDSLTGLLNRRVFTKEIETFCSNPSLNRTFSILMIDIDNFKAFNDDFGHQLGDQVLKAIAKRISDSCQEGEQVFRYGGEEFVLILPNKTFTIARQNAESIRRAIERLSIRDKRTGKVIDNITISIGVSENKPRDSSHEILTRADLQLYEAKRLGRNRVMPLPR